MIKRLISIAPIISIGSTLGFIYLKIFVHPPFGPLGIILLSLLISISIFFIISFHLYRTDRPQTLVKIWMSFCIDQIWIFSSNNNVQLLNLFPAFRSYNGKSRLYYNHDMHWTETGHRLMAQQFEHWLRSHGAMVDHRTNQWL